MRLAGIEPARGVWASKTRPSGTQVHSVYHFRHSRTAGPGCSKSIPGPLRLRGLLSVVEQQL